MHPGPIASLPTVLVPAPQRPAPRRVQDPQLPAYELRAATCQQPIDRAEIQAALPGVPVWAIDADGIVVRPGPRPVDDIEVIASILHPAAPPNPAHRGPTPVDAPAIDQLMPPVHRGTRPPVSSDKRAEPT